MGSAAATMAQPYAGGGKVKGKGTGTSDSVRTMLSKGEFVMPADSVRTIGVKTLMAMKDATHKPTGKSGRGPVRRMADGGLVDDTPKPMSYGQQMANVGGFFGNAVKSLVSAPGYGFNAPAAVPDAGAGRGQVNPAAVIPNASATLAATTLPPDVTASTAGAGRGTLNPPIASATGAARPDLAGIPSLGGSTGTAVDGAAGVRKFVQGGKTLYSNVAGADNDKLMSSTPGVQTIPAQSGGAIATMSAPSPTAAKAQYDQEVADAAATNARGGFNTGQTDQSPRAMILSQLAGRKLSVRGAQLLGGLATSDASTGAQIYGTNVGAGTAAARLATETPEIQARTAEMAAQAKLRQGTIVAQQAMMAAKTPEEREVAEQNLRATLGKDHVVRGIGVSLPTQANGMPGGGAVWDDRTRSFQYPQAPQAAEAPPSNHIAALKANPKLAAQFDAQYGQGASKQYLGAK